MRKSEAKFWDTHDFTEFEDELTPVNVHFAKQLSDDMLIHFDRPTLTKIRKVANEKGIKPMILAKTWILERLRQTTDRATL